MKTIAKILAVIAAAACMAVVGIGCGPKGYVDKSNAVELGAFDRPDYAREMEEKHDREGREHIEIPDGAETITIDSEEYIPITKWSEIDQSNKNYIMKCDIDVSNSTHVGNIRYPFRGKFHGNNYKIKGKSSTAVFAAIEDAIITNVIISSEFEHGGHAVNVTYSDSIFIQDAKNSVISDCVNYATPRNEVDGVIGTITNTSVMNCYNYADMRSYSGLVNIARDKFRLSNCYNYGNISSDSVCGGILTGYHYAQTIEIEDDFRGSIENCVNVGKLIGGSAVGGIVGCARNYFWILEFVKRIGEGFYSSETVKLYEDDIKDYNEGIAKQEILSTVSCRNDGDIYRSKDTKKEWISGIGGIAGIGSVIRSCTNNGRIYGYESLHPDVTVNKIGGVAGGAYIVEDCTSTTQLQLADTIVQYGDICGFLAKD